jgi:N-acetylmuramoyl-L-alanine amidase
MLGPTGLHPPGLAATSKREVTMTKIVPIHEPSIAFHAPAGAFGHGSMTPVRVVLHDTECGDAAGITEIEGVVNFWMRTDQPDRLGAHYIVDATGNIGKLADGTELLYHVGGLNTGSIGIEQIGFASFTEADWLRRPEQLDKVARLLAYLHHEYAIPLEVPSPQGASQANRGVMTHAMVSRFEPASEGHSDPGSGYPLAHVLAAAKGYVKAGGWARPGESTPAKPKRKPAPMPQADVSWTDVHGHVQTTRIHSHNPYWWLFTHHPKSWRRGGAHVQPVPPKKK